MRAREVAEIWQPRTRPLAAFQDGLEDDDILALLRDLRILAAERGLSPESEPPLGKPVLPGPDECVTVGRNDFGRRGDRQAQGLPQEMASALSRRRQRSGGGRHGWTAPHPGGRDLLRRPVNVSSGGLSMFLCRPVNSDSRQPSCRVLGLALMP